MYVSKLRRRVTTVLFEFSSIFLFLFFSFHVFMNNNSSQRKSNFSSVWKRKKNFNKIVISILKRFCSSLVLILNLFNRLLFALSCRQFRLDDFHVHARITFNVNCEHIVPFNGFNLSEWMARVHFLWCKFSIILSYSFGVFTVFFVCLFYRPHVPHVFHVSLHVPKTLCSVVHYMILLKIVRSNNSNTWHWIWYHQSKQWSVREFVTRAILPFKSVITLQINYKYYYYFLASIFVFRRFLLLSLSFFYPIGNILRICCYRKIYWSRLSRFSRYLISSCDVRIFIYNLTFKSMKRDSYCQIWEQCIL